MADDSEFLTAQQAAERAGVTPRTIRSWALQGLLPRHTTIVGARRTYYLAADLDRLIQPTPQDQENHTNE